jgi:DNA-binding MarR family transcriptional regulator
VTTDTQPTTAQLPLVALLDRAQKLVLAELHERLSQAGLANIRDAHGCVFGNIQPEGSRLTELAERAGITKQAVGEAVADLERLGYVDRVPDPADGRAKIIRLTEAGREAQSFGFDVMQGIERRWAEQHGEERMTGMRDLLEQVVADNT